MMLDNLKKKSLIQDNNKRKFHEKKKRDDWSLSKFKYF